MTMQGTVGGGPGRVRRRSAIDRSPPPPPKQGWLDERLGVRAFYEKYGRKAFPVHHTFFFGEMAVFSFIILIVTGVYLGLIYVPSNAEVTIDGETLPEAYASTQLIESIPVANLFRNVHHWGAHLMVISILLHTVRIFFTGTYRKPREVNWVIGVVLLGLTLLAGFVGYSLPYDSYAVTATGIGYAIARSIPWVGETASELFFGGNFPTLGSLPRLYTIHVFIVPALLALLMGLHVLIVTKQKHSQPGYAKKLAEPGRVLGVPLWPYQALLAGQLLLLMFGALFILSAIVPAHPLDAYGPPGPGTQEVKPDWYLLWIYGLLEILPASIEFNLFGEPITTNFIAGIAFPAVFFGLITLAPWLDRTNLHATNRFEYMEPPRQSGIRLACGFYVLALLCSLFLAGFHRELGMSLPVIWSIVFIGPVVVAGAAFALARATYKDAYFDPTSEDAPSVSSPGVETYGAPGSGIEPGDFVEVDGYARDGLVGALRRAESMAGTDGLGRDERDEALARIDRLRERLVSEGARDGGEMGSGPGPPGAG